MVNFEKMVRHRHLHTSLTPHPPPPSLPPLPVQRLVARKVRCLNDYRSSILSSDIRLLANKSPQLQMYIRLVQL